MLLLRPEFMFREMAEKRKRICERVLELLFFLRKNYSRIHKEIIVIEKSITIELRSYAHKRIQ